MHAIIVVGTNVVAVLAVDNDRDHVMYELDSDAQGRFKINIVTGQITSNVVIDREVSKDCFIKQMFLFLPIKACSCFLIQSLNNDRLDFHAYAYDNVTGRGQRVSTNIYF